jgi:hypothetical protein
MLSFNNLRCCEGRLFCISYHNFGSMLYVNVRGLDRLTIPDDLHTPGLAMHTAAHLCVM